MNLEEKKQTLLHIVHKADDRLTGLLIALANEYYATNEPYSPEEVEGFYEIRDQLLKEPDTTYTPTEAHQILRNKD